MHRNVKDKKVAILKRFGKLSKKNIPEGVFFN